MYVTITDKNFIVISYVTIAEQLHVCEYYCKQNITVITYVSFPVCDYYW